MVRICVGLFLFVAYAVASGGPCRAGIFVPGDTIPGVVSGDVFSWSRGDEGSSYNGWDRFESVSTVAGAPFTDNTADLPGRFGANGSISVSGGTIPVSSGNAYSFAVPLSFSAIAPTGTLGDFTRIVAQFRTIGTEMDYSSVLLSSNTASLGTIAPNLLLETGRSTLGGFGGASVDFLAVWDIASSQPEFRLDFNSAGAIVDAMNVFHNERIRIGVPAQQAWIAPIDIADIAGADGTSSTLLAGEYGGQIREFSSLPFPFPGGGGESFGRWANSYPYSSTASVYGKFNAKKISLFDIPSYESFRGPHIGGVQFVVSDGGVRFLTETGAVIAPAYDVNSQMQCELRPGQNDGLSYEVEFLR